MIFDHMSGIKVVLPILCQCVNSLTDITLVPEYLRLAKYDAPDKNGVSVRFECTVYRDTLDESVERICECFALGGDAVEDAARFKLLCCERGTE